MISGDLQMFRFFLLMVSVLAVSTSMAEEVSPCSNTVPIQIISVDPQFDAATAAITERIAVQLAKEKLCITGAKNTESMGDPCPNTLPIQIISADSPDAQFSVFVDAVTERIAVHLAKEKLCITGAKSTESMSDAAIHHHSLLQFVYWPLFTGYEYLVPVMTYPGGQPPPSCRISSPWIDLVVDRGASPSIRGIVYWNERQLLADQAVLAGARNVPLGMAMLVVALVAARFLFEKNPPLPPTKTFRCAKCSVVEEYSPRTIEAWRKGFKRLYCKKCHRAWLDRQPGRVPDRTPSGCAPVFLFGLIFLIVIYATAGNLYYRGSTQSSGKPPLDLKQQITNSNPDGMAHESSTTAKP
jgi:hypothetical protein